MTYSIDQLVLSEVFRVCIQLYDYLGHWPEVTAYQGAIVLLVISFACKKGNIL